MKTMLVGNFICPECGQILEEKAGSNGKLVFCSNSQWYRNSDGHRGACKLYGKIFKVPLFELETANV